MSALFDRARRAGIHGLGGSLLRAFRHGAGRCLGKAVVPERKDLRARFGAQAAADAGVFIHMCDVTRSVSKMTEIERRGGKRWDKPKKAEKSRDCGGGKF